MGSHRSIQTRWCISSWRFINAKGSWLQACLIIFFIVVGLGHHLLSHTQEFIQVENFPGVVFVDVSFEAGNISTRISLHFCQINYIFSKAFPFFSYITGYTERKKVYQKGWLNASMPPIRSKDSFSVCLFTVAAYYTFPINKEYCPNWKIISRWKILLLFPMEILCHFSQRKQVSHERSCTAQP